jgi:hypothetical protein
VTAPDQCCRRHQKVLAKAPSTRDPKWTSCASVEDIGAAYVMEDGAFGMMPSGPGDEIRRKPVVDRLGGNLHGLVFRVV